jgi:hypothetical protein
MQQNFGVVKAAQLQKLLNVWQSKINSPTL